jgi:electron transport complex protein RnfD
VLFAIVAVKHLYGGLGQNPFNPAMIAFCSMIVAYPALMSQWPAAGFSWRFRHPARADPRRAQSDLDAITGATPLDALRTGLRAGERRRWMRSCRARPSARSAASGWEWISAATSPAASSCSQQRIITWHMPVAFIVTLRSDLRRQFWLFESRRTASPRRCSTSLSGGAMLAAFFIVTDPVSGATTPRGKLLFAAGIALHRLADPHFGAYPEGIAFGVLLMNLCVPLIDMKTQPPVFGHRNDAKGAGK